VAWPEAVLDVVPVPEQAATRSPAAKRTAHRTIGTLRSDRIKVATPRYRLVRLSVLALWVVYERQAIPAAFGRSVFCGDW